MRRPLTWIVLTIALILWAILMVYSPVDAARLDLKTTTGEHILKVGVGEVFEYRIDLTLAPGDGPIRHIIAVHETPSQCFTIAGGCRPRTPTWNHLSAYAGGWTPDSQFWGAGVVRSGLEGPCENRCVNWTRGWVRVQLGDYDAIGPGLRESTTLATLVAVVNTPGTYELRIANDLGAASGRDNKWQVYDGTEWWYGAWYGPAEAGTPLTLIVGDGVVGVEPRTWGAVKGLYK